MYRAARTGGTNTREARWDERKAKHHFGTWNIQNGRDTEFMYCAINQSTNHYHHRHHRFFFFFCIYLVVMTHARCCWLSSLGLWIQGHCTSTHDGLSLSLGLFFLFQFFL